VSFSVWFSFDQAPLFVKRNAVAQDLVIFMPSVLPKRRGRVMSITWTPEVFNISPIRPVLSM
jgi:hypothetical protein